MSHPAPLLIQSIPTKREVDTGPEHLLRTDSVASRVELYLRLLYSPRYAAAAQRWLADEPSQLPPETAAFLRTIDAERLAIEQKARARNLTQWLRDQSGALFTLLPEAEHLPLVSRFADSEQFWEGRGRSMQENFCLYAARELAQRGDELLADVVRFFGVFSGLRSAQAGSTPWSDWGHLCFVHPEGPLVEQMKSRWALMDTSGELPGSARIERLRADAPGQYRLTLCLLPDKSVVVDCQPC